MRCFDYDIKLMSRTDKSDEMCSHMKLTRLRQTEIEILKLHVASSSWNNRNQQTNPLVLILLIQEKDLTVYTFL